MNRHAFATIEERRARGLPYIDPFSGKVVSGTRVAEQSPGSPNPESS